MADPRQSRSPRSSNPAGAIRHLAVDERAVSPAVAKTLEAGIVTLYVALVAAVLLGGVVPEYRTAAGDAVGERALVAAAHHVEDAVPATGRAVRVERSVDLPATIRGEPYAIVVDRESLVLAHPAPGIGGRIVLAVPPRVGTLGGRWESSSPSSVVVTGNTSAWRVRLVNGDEP